MRKILVAVLLLMPAWSPAMATQAMVCEGKGASITMLIGNAAVPGLVNAELMSGGAAVPSAVARSWLDDKQMMIDLADPEQMAVIASLRLTYGKRAWRGTLTYKGRKIPVVCDEG